MLNTALCELCERYKNLFPIRRGGAERYLCQKIRKIISWMFHFKSFLLRVAKFQEITFVIIYFLMKFPILFHVLVSTNFPNSRDVISPWGEFVLIDRHTNCITQFFSHNIVLWYVYFYFVKPLRTPPPKKPLLGCLIFPTPKKLKRGNMSSHLGPV